MAEIRAEAKRLAAQVKGARRAFERAFALAQESLPPAARRDFKMIATTGVDRDDFAACFDFAHAQGWLEQLIFACIAAQVASKMMLRRVRLVQPADAPDPKPRKRARRAQDRQTLESVVNDVPDGAEAVVYASEVLQLTKQACLIYRDNQAKGTGTLIAPDLVLTAWHVVADEFENGEPRPDAATRVEVEFDRVTATVATTAVPPLRVKLAAAWHVDSSTCHPKELHGLLPTKVKELAQHLDYVVLRLAQPMDRKRSFRPISKVRAITDDLPIVICHHPQGKNLQVGHGRIAGTMTPSAPRFFHRVDALPGSSGAACFDTQFRFVGIHQAGYAEDLKLPKAKRRNRGVPADAIAQQLIARIVGATYREPIWRLNDRAPAVAVIGTSDFQEMIAASAQAGEEPRGVRRVITITGAAGTGKTFALRVLRAGLPAAESVVVELNPTDFPPTAEEFIRLLLSACGMARPDAVELPKLAEADTTEDAWLRNQLAPQFEAEVGKAIGGRRLWLLIDQPEGHAVPAGPARKFLDVMLEQIAATTWLRIVLAGFKDPLPPRARLAHQEFVLRDPTQAQVMEYLGYRAGTQAGFPELAKALFLMARAGVKASRGKLTLIRALAGVVNEIAPPS